MALALNDAYQTVVSQRGRIGSLTISYQTRQQLANLETNRSTRVQNAKGRPYGFMQLGVFGKGFFRIQCPVIGIPCQ